MEFPESFRNGVLLILTWVAWVACLRGQCTCMENVLAWVGWVACLHGWRWLYAVIIDVVIIEILS